MAKKKDYISLSPKHGVNPMMVSCFICGQDTGELALLGRLKGDAQAPHRASLDRAPCEKCKEHMAKGIILISVRDGESGDNPYRTGGWAVVKEEAVKRIAPPGLVDDICRHRMAFVPDAAWDSLGLPREKDKA